ncbi:MULTISPECIES: FAD-dependent oxidoreductase [unclassified Solwaraspora]|uniref:FAD-dependent oxidoreductase n=1 Tax=unclassified Solwaraspora TaxID=2627926 RepID=UPI00259B8616|nr:FAD-dependent oxidoreductase [Solwaraspora sp. WMMA2056]WJK38485.1 FAD-dependent oxidoreductase [Solwaraspora sp. WMMA2056]
MADVVVVGAGIIGLTCALRLQQRGLRVTVVYAEPPARTVSALAAAVWYPTRTDAAPAVLDQAGRTFEVFAGQAGERVPGVTMRPTRMLLRAGVDGPPWWSPAVPDLRYCAVVAASDPAPAAPDPVAPAPPTGAGPVVAEWRCTVPAVEMRPYLDWLVDRLVAGGAVLRQRRLATLAQAAQFAPVVVNASGLAAGVLTDDPAVHPVRGQVVVVANPGVTTSVRDEAHPDGPTYVHPRAHDVVLGGTFEPDADAAPPDPATSRAIRQRCVALVPQLSGAPVHGEYVGLRPARRGGARVGVDPDPPPGVTRLVHCYGHGGAGMTLSWGCADQVAAHVTGQVG